MSTTIKRVLYGVQGTGNGHISRARAMAPHLARAGVQVDFLFSGRARDKYFDMEVFGAWRCHAGLTFVCTHGKISPLATLKKNNLPLLLKDINNLDLSPYDLVISDFEPITAWAARRRKINSISLGHQSAFNFDIPTEGDSWVTRKLMQWFAPAPVQIGLHWHHFNGPIFPPIIDLTETRRAPIKDKILVYLGFEAPEEVIPLLQAFPHKRFVYYGDFPQSEERGNVALRPLSRNGFKHDLADCEGVISNAGFELISEALHFGKKVLAKPLNHQVEQLSNARALRELKLGASMRTLNKDAIATWLSSAHAPRCEYPDVAQAITQFIISDNPPTLQVAADQLWGRTRRSSGTVNGSSWIQSPSQSDAL